MEFPTFQADRFAVALWMRSGALPEMTVLEGGPGFEIGVEESHPQPDFKRGSPLYVEFQGNRWHSKDIIFGGQWHHVILNFEDGTPRLVLDGKPAEMDAVKQIPVRPAGPLAIGDPHLDRPFKGDVGDLRIYDRLLASSEAEPLALHAPIRYLLSVEEGKRSKEQKQRLLDYFLTYAAAADLSKVYREFNLLKNTDPGTRYFLVKQGKDVVVARIDLSGMDDVIGVLSGRAETVSVLDQVRAEVGDDPEVWLPIFTKRIKQA